MIFKICESAKKAIFVILKMIMILWASIAVGAISLTLVYIIPTSSLKRNVENSIIVYNTNPIEDWNKNYSFYTQTDMQTESVKIMEAISDGEGNAFFRAMDSIYYLYEGCSPMESLIKYISGEENPIPISYARYWHGYVLYLKPLLLFASLSTIKIINMTLQFVLCIILAVLLRDKLGLFYSLAFCGLVLVLNPVTIFLSMQNDVIFYITVISSIILLLRNRQMNKNNNFVFFFMFIGIAVAFFDFFTYPAVSIGVPLIIYLLINEGNIKQYFTNIVLYSVSWLVGYVGMWAGKWILSDLFWGTNVVQNGIQQLIYRSSGDPYGETAEMDSSFIHTISKNIQVINLLSLKLFLAIVVCLAILIVIKKKKGFADKKAFAKFFAVILVSLYPFGWYFIVRNHSVIHPWIEYRELSLFVFGMLCSLGILIGNTNWEYNY